MVEQGVSQDSARTQQAFIGGLEVDSVMIQKVHNDERMESQQGVTKYAEDLDKALRKDAVGRNNERTWNQQWFSRDSSGTQ